MAEARKGALVAIQNYLINFSHTGAHIDITIGASAAEEGAAAGAASAASPKTKKRAPKDDASIQPRSWLVILLKIIKLDGHFPDLASGVTTRDQLERMQKQQAEEGEEDEAVAAARLDFLLHTAYVMLEMCTVALYHKFLLHPPAAPQPTSASDKSPPTAAAAAGVRHVFQLLPLLFLAHHPDPHVSKCFLERVMQLLHANRISWAVWQTALVLGQTHPDRALVTRIQHTLWSGEQPATHTQEKPQRTPHCFDRLLISRVFAVVALLCV